MDIVPFVHEGLGNSSDLVEVAEGEAILVDPDRSIHRYLQAAYSRGWSIVSIFETHLHADFVSGSLEASHVTGAQVYLPEGAQARFPHQPLSVGQRVRVSEMEIEAIDSPGHTPEHMSYVFRPQRQTPALFSGGALIVGGAARTDLISPEMTEPLTRSEYRTLKRAFMSLADETLLYPTHGGGSFCSAGSTSQRISTLGEERARNPLLAINDEEEFVSWFPSTFPPGIPDYFFRMRPINQAGPRLSSEVPKPPSLSPSQFDAAREHALVMDVRPYEEYAEAHILGSVNNAFRSAYGTYLGWVVPPETPLKLVTGDVPLDRVIEESLLVGHELFAGWLDRGMNSWIASKLPVQGTEVVDAGRAREALVDGALALDVRERNEFESGHIEGAVNLPVGDLATNLDKIPKNYPIVAYCGHGERSSTALSLLERAGIGPTMNLRGGLGAWQGAGNRVALGSHPVVDT